MVRIGSVLVATMCCLAATAEAQSVVAPTTAPRLQLAPQAINPSRPVLLACPAQLATYVLPADVKPPWASASGSVLLIGAVVRPEPGGGKRAILECSYKSPAATYAHVNLWTYAPMNACVVAGDQKSFACIQGTAFSRT
jgi:hypothetical protein